MSEKAIFLDRDDTLIKDPGYINAPEQVKLLEGVPACLRGFRKLGYKLVMVTNQSAVARGIVTEEVLARIHARLEELLKAKGVRLDRIYYCPFHPEGSIKKYRKPSDWRKPNPGMLLAAAQELDIDLQRSWCIGNSPSDVEAGARAGCQTILVNQMSPVDGFSRDQIKPDYMAVNMRETLNIVKKYSRSAQETAAPQPVPESPAEEKETHPPVAPPAVEAETRLAVELPVVEAETQPAPPAELKTEALAAEEAVKPAPASQPEPPTEEPKDAQALAPDPAPSPPPPEAFPDTAPDSTDQLLREILSQLKAMQREDMFDEFSLVRLMAGITQTAVPFCLLIALWFLLTIPRQYEPVFTALGFAIVLQVMSLTLNMHARG